MWTETTTILIDYALSNCYCGHGKTKHRIEEEEVFECKEINCLCKIFHSKNFVMILHERVSEKPGQQTGKVIVSTGGKGEKTREYIGTMDVRIAGSIEGAFGLEFGSYFTDVYGLRVEAERDKAPKWVCRVHPDNQRDLRCSFDTKNVLEFEPDFRKIWGSEWK